MCSCKDNKWKIVTERVKVVRSRLNSGGGNGSGCLEIKIRTDIAQFVQDKERNEI